MDIKNNMRVVQYERPQEEHGYKYLISNGVYAYTAYKTDQGFNFFLESRNLELNFKEEFENEQKGKVIIYDVIGTIEECSFWTMEEIPNNAERFTGLSNGSLVDCYYVHTSNGSIVYRPNPNAKEVYKPLPIDEHIAYQRING